MQISVNIIIPTLWKQPALLEACLQSISKLKLSGVQLQVIVVSNVSHKQHRNFQSSIHVPENITVIWIVTGKNLGFAGATNLGFAHSLADYYVCLNDDTQVDQFWLYELIKTQKKTGAEMIASTIYLADKQTLDSQGFTLAWRGKAEALIAGQSSLNSLPDHWLRHKGAFSRQDKAFWQEPFGPDAAACLYTKKLIDTVGVFRADFFAYLEDVELALRARKQGFYCALATDAIVYHHKHATSSTMSSFKARQDMVNWWKIVLTYPYYAWQNFTASILIERLKNISGFIKSLVA
jgi:GT2 family glycosyltransferase